MKIAIKGDKLRGKEVIQILESLGGNNCASLKGSNQHTYYGIYKNWIMVLSNLTGYKQYTLEEFEKEFPFKIGDKVKDASDNEIGTITDLISINNILIYNVDFVDSGQAFMQSNQLKPYKGMKEERNIKLTLEKAKEWYKKGGELKEVALQAYSEEELTKVELPKTWEEFCKNYPVKIGETWTGSSDTIYSATMTQKRLYKNWIPSKKSAEAHLAMIQLEQLRNCWRQGWEPDWSGRFEKWNICLCGNELSVVVTTIIPRFLTFPTKEMAKEFLECFRNLIEKAGDLI